MIRELNERAQAVLRHVVDTYLESGEPVGSRTLSRLMSAGLSPATIRNVMADLEAGGLLYAPHTSAGRLPTQQGLRIYIDGLMQIGQLGESERREIEVQCHSAGQSMPQMMERASTMLSGLSSGAGLVMAPKTDKPIRQIQFVPLDHGRALTVLVMQDNTVENRVMEIGPDVTPASLVAASNYLTSRLAQRTVTDAQQEIAREIAENRAQLDRITSGLVERGLALAPSGSTGGHIIIRGQSQLLQDVKEIDELEKARHLLAALEEQQTLSRLLEATQKGDGVQIFIGAENQMFEHAGWSVVIAPYRSSGSQIIGAIGVIGPTRLNYSRIIPILDYTAKVMARAMGD